MYKPDMKKGLLILAGMHKDKANSSEADGADKATGEVEMRQVAEQLINAIKREDVDSIINALHMSYALCKDEHEMKEEEGADDPMAEGSY